MGHTYVYATSRMIEVTPPMISSCPTSLKRSTNTLAAWNSLPLSQARGRRRGDRTRSMKRTDARARTDPLISIFEAAAGRVGAAAAACIKACLRGTPREGEEEGREIICSLPCLNTYNTEVHYRNWESSMHALVHTGRTMKAACTESRRPRAVRRNFASLEN